MSGRCELCMGIKAVYSPKERERVFGMEDCKEMDMDIPAGSIPPWKGLDCRCSSDPCLAPLSLQSVVAGSTSADRQNYCLFSRPCSQNGKASKTSPRVLGCIQPGCHVQVIPKRLKFVYEILQWRSQYAPSGCFHKSPKLHARQQYVYVVPAHFQQLPLRNLGIINGPRSNIQKAGPTRRRPQSAQYSYKPLRCTPNVCITSQLIISQP